MFRSLGKSKISLVLAVLFGLSLFLIRGGDRYSGLFDSDNIVATVSGTPISTSKFLRVLQMNINQYSQMFGRPLKSEEIQTFQIHSMALGGLVNNAVFENEFDTKKFIIDETVVASETKKRFPELYDKNNKINELSLNAFLSKQNLKIDDLVKIIDYEIRDKAFNKLFFEVNYPSEINNILNKHDDHIRKVDLINFNINDFNLPNLNDLDVSINNSEIVDYFNQNIKSYIDPEKRDISYILINKNEYTDQLTPSDNQIESYYNNNKNLYLESERRDFIQFNFKNLNEASQFKNNISSLKKDEIIKFAKDNNVVFNDFLKVTENEVLQNLADVIFNIQKNQISEIIETPLAKHIIVVNNIYPETQKTLEQSKKEISNNLLDVEVDGYISDLKNKINQQILDGLSINEIAMNNALDVLLVNKAEKLNNNFEEDLIQNEVISRGFAINKDFVSDIIDIDSEKAIIINVEKIFNEKPFSLQEIFDLVSKDWIKSLKIKSLDKKVNEVSDSTKSIKEISEFTNVKINNINIKLDNVDYPLSFKNNIFSNDINQLSITIAGDEIYISSLNKISFPEIEENNKNTLMASELRSNFGAEIIKNKNISTNDNLIQALISQY